MSRLLCFFFQAEDGIRDGHVTGVQTCALPIYLDGDTYSMTVSLDEGAELMLTTQSSTKVYKTLHSHAYQETTFYLKKYSYLEYLQDALIVYKYEKYYKINIVQMTVGATLMYS